MRNKCTFLFTQWSSSYRNTPGLERISNLYKDLPTTPRPHQARQKVLEESGTAHSDDNPAAARRPSDISRHRPSASSSRSPFPLSSHRKHSSSSTPFNLAKEKDTMTNTIAQASIASTNLLNGLQLTNRETERVSQKPEVVQRFETCKHLRRQILHYIQHVESEDWIGSLVNANDELVKALTAYEITDRSIEDDSDSDAWEQLPSSSSSHVAPTTQKQLASLSLNDSPPPRPPRPNAIAMPAQPQYPTVPKEERREHSGEENDDDDPFGDANAVPTPVREPPSMTWKEAWRARITRR